jgi:hypothetical protein
MGDDSVELAQLGILVLDGGTRALVQRHQHELLGDVQSQQLDLLHAQPTHTLNTYTALRAFLLACTTIFFFFLIASPVSSTVIQHSKAFILALPQGVFHLFSYLINGQKHTMYLYWLYHKFFISVVEHSKHLYWLVQKVFDFFPRLINCQRALSVIILALPQGVFHFCHRALKALPAHNILACAKSL